MAASRTLTKAERIERARLAGKASMSLDGFITRIVNRADELTPEHVDRLRALLPPVADDREGAEA